MQYKGQNEPIMSVGDVVKNVRDLIENNYPILSIEGEISNFSQPNSGHWYFTLKDANAQIRCAMFINRNRLVAHPVKNGDQVLVRARLSVYEQRGDFQAIIEHIEPAGEGALRAAFEKLKSKLSIEGLFDSSVKRPLPDFPRHLAIISSISGAALQDVLSVIQRRFPSMKTTVVAATVQGESAEVSILEALKKITNIKPLPDVTLITRGGGSLEDLSVFNTESIARSIRSFPIPIVSAIGHEIDFTISDFVADVRAPTPSVAAELITPNTEEIAKELLAKKRQLYTKSNNDINYFSERISTLSKRLTHPGTNLKKHALRLKELTYRMVRSVEEIENYQRLQLKHAQRILQHRNPNVLISDKENHIERLFKILHSSLKKQLTEKKIVFTSMKRTLNTVSPLATVDRGFAIITTKTSSDVKGKLVHSVSDLEKGSTIEAQISDGKVIATVEALRDR